MLVIADNITTRNPMIDRLFRELETGDWSQKSRPYETLKTLVSRCVGAGADTLEINIQQHHDRPEVMESAVRAIQNLTDRQLCLSTNNAGSLEVGLAACRRPPLVNYVSLDADRLKAMLPLAARYSAEVVLLASKVAAPADARDMLGMASVLVGAANEAGIPNERIYIDPGVIHITHDIGQSHLVDVKEFLKSLPETFEPQVKSTCWLGNVSTDAPQALRPALEASLLAVLATLGLSSVFMDLLQPENERMLRLLKVFNNEKVYSHGDVELRLA